MAFTEDLDVFLSDFGQAVIRNGVSYKGILEQPDEIVADGLVMTTDYELTGKTSELGSLVFDDIISVDGDNYKVRQARKIDDGKFCTVSLNKL
tara:strand:- start:521 stop:799 length:279 start_codon:yes stop_codon:yes gene_type:complete